MPALKTQLVALGSLATLLAAAVSAGAAITSLTVNPCLSGKVKAVGKSLAARTNCLSKDAKRGTPDPTCLQKASDKFTGDGTPANGTFEKLETRFPNTDPTPCLTFDDQSAFEGDIATYAASVPTETGSATGRCDAAKIKCTGKYVSAIASCFAKAAKSTATVDGACTAKAVAKLFGAGRGCLDKAVARGDCTHASNQGFDLQIGADAFLKSTTCALDPTNPGCGCPASYTFTANGSDADFDVGWTGANHDGDMPSMSRLTLAVSGCPNTTSPCGTCTLSGPISNPGGPSFANRRCRGDEGGDGPWVPCVSDSDCAGTNNACVFFFGPPRPDHLGFGELCTLTEIAGSIAGAVDPDSGASTLTVPLTTRTYAAGTIDDPCPTCTAGTCSAGARAGMACTVQGHGTIFDEDVSLDCPPLSGARVDTRTFAITLGTGTQMMTLDGASPFCRAGGFTADRCFCDTCNNANAEGCTSDAACPPSGGNPGICGGKRCLGGSNTGAPCVVSSECTGGGCAVPGVGTAPNQCDDGMCTPNTPPDLASTNEGTCASGPVDSVCSSQTYRMCATASDCPVSGDTCVARPRDCFTTNGQLGDTVSARGQADPVAPTLATLYCTGPTSAPIINSIRGLPGLARYTIPGVVTTN